MAISKRLWALVKGRDEGAYCCDAPEEFWVPQHRAGRGMGGGKTADEPANVIVFCARHNGLLESDAGFAEAGRQAGWKLRRSGPRPAEVPVRDVSGRWWWLSASGTRALVTDGGADEFLQIPGQYTIDDAL